MFMRNILEHDKIKIYLFWLLYFSNKGFSYMTFFFISTFDYCFFVHELYTKWYGVYESQNPVANAINKL